MNDTTTQNLVLLGTILYKTFSILSYEMSFYIKLNNFTWNTCILTEVDIWFYLNYKNNQKYRCYTLKLEKCKPFDEKSGQSLQYCLQK